MPPSRQPGPSADPMALRQAMEQAQTAAAGARHEDVLALTERCLAVADAATLAELSEVRFLRADALRHLGYWDQAAVEFGLVAAFEGEPALLRRACRAHRLLSEIARRSKDLEAARNSAEAARRLADELEDRAGWFLASIALARILSDQGQAVAAESLLREVLSAAPTVLAADHRELPLVQTAGSTVLSLLLFRAGQISDALALLNGARESSEQVRHPITRAAYHRQLAILHEVQRNYATAIRNLNEALALYDSVRFEPGRYDVNWSLSWSYTNLGDLRTARLCLEQCIALAERLNLRFELGKSKSSFADLAVREGQYEAAVALYHEDLAVSREVADAMALGHCTRKLADCYRLGGNWALAETHARESMAHFAAAGRAGEVEQVRVLLGRLLVEAGRVDEAATVLATARAQLGDRPRRSALADLRLAEGLLHRARGDLDQAVAAFAESLALQDEQDPTRELATTHFEAGRTLRANGDPGAAKQQLRQAVETAGLLGSRDLWARALDEFRELDLMEAQRLMLKPYLPGGAVDELSGGEAVGRLETATTMFVDMRGATALSGTLGPLELAEVVSAFLGPVVRIILRWGGSVDKFIGDCVMAVFGLQDATDGAEAAVRAGLEIVEYMEATRAIRQRAGASVLEATIGINTGEVVAGCFGPLLRRDYTVIGYHVNLAQRLQSVAGAVEDALGTRMVISESTRRGLLTEVPCSRVDLGDLQLKGIDSDDITIWHVRAAEALAQR